MRHVFFDFQLRAARKKIFEAIRDAFLDFQQRAAKPYVMHSLSCSRAQRELAALIEMEWILGSARPCAS